MIPMNFKTERFNTKKKAVNLLLDESIDKDDYDLLMKELNPQIDQLKAKN